jgi:hypothetical protein
MVEDLFRGEYVRRSFVALVLCATVILLLVRFLLLPTFDSTLAVKFWAALAVLTDGLLSTFVTTVLIGLLIFWLVPPKPDPSIMVLSAKEISPALEMAMTKTRSWLYKGGTGRYLRAVTIPTLARLARLTNSTCDLRVQILDPTNTALCAAYAQYRSGLSSATQDNESWTPDRVRNELLTTILKLALARQDNPLLTVRLFFAKAFSTFRIDLSEAYVIVTREDDREAAFKFTPDSPFYGAYREETYAAMGQAVEFTIPPALNLDQMTPAHIQQWIDSLGMFSELPDGGSCTYILNNCRDSPNPYA